jgi:hypothetical protein
VALSAARLVDFMAADLSALDLLVVRALWIWQRWIAVSQTLISSKATSIRWRWWKGRPRMPQRFRPCWTTWSRAEALVGLDHAGSDPSQGHAGIPPAFDVARDAANGAHHVLGDVGTGERSTKLLRQLQPDNGQDFVEAFEDAGRHAGPLLVESTREIAESRRTCRSNCPPNLNLLSISRPQRRLASNCQQRSSPLPTK